MGVGWGRPRRIMFSRNRVRAPGWPGNTQVVILQFCADRLTLEEAPPSLGLGTPLWGQLGYGLGPSPL